MKYWVKYNAAVIKDILSITGVIAGNKNLLNVLNIPADRAVRDINNKYGKVICNISDAITCLFSVWENPGANILTITSEKITPIAVISIKINSKFPWI